jgi:hypothetical protein
MIMNTILVFILIISASMASPLGFKKTCPEIDPQKLISAPAGFNDWLKSKNLHVINQVDKKNLIHFYYYFLKFPLALRLEMEKGGATLILMEGSGVTVDPDFNSKTTFDSRDWNFVPGSSGRFTPDKKNLKTRIVINKLHEGHGSVNLVLHEMAHTLDSLYGVEAVSTGKMWKSALFKSLKIKDFLQTICTNNYCASSSAESFAELFAYYHACRETRMFMTEHVPEIAFFFKNFKEIKSYLD